MKEERKRGRLYVVSTHIGNKEDITLRAIEILKLCDLIVCEEMSIGSVLLKDLRINKKLDTLNEQNEEEKVLEFARLMDVEDKKLALISDCGTPVFADPGFHLVQQALSQKIDVIVVPGATSLMAALVRSGMPLQSFLYAGFLSRKSEERIAQIRKLAEEPRTVAILDTPYRLLSLLEDIIKVIPNRQAYIGMNLTMPYETHHYGTFYELYQKFKAEKVKAEFVICFEGNLSNLPIEFQPHNTSLDRNERSQNMRERSFNGRRGERKSFNKGPRKSFDRDRKPFDRDRKPFDRDRKPFDREKKPFDRDRKPFDKDRRKPFDRDKKPFDKEKRNFDGERPPRRDGGRSFDNNKRGKPDFRRNKGGSGRNNFSR